MNQFRRRRHQTGEPCDCLRPVIRIFGILTSFVICGVGIDIYMHGYKAGLFILFCSILIFFFEIKWLITLFLHLLLDNRSTCLKCWSCWRFFGGWRLSLPYVAVGTYMFMWPHNLWLSYVAGILLIMLALLRLLTLIRFTNNTKDIGLLPQCEFQKVDSCSDIPEDGYAEVSPSLEDEEPIDEIC